VVLSLLLDAPAVWPAGEGGVPSNIADRLVATALCHSGALPLPTTVCSGHGFGRDKEGMEDDGVGCALCVDGAACRGL
jgi:hypothetical protein